MTRIARCISVLLCGSAMAALPVGCGNQKSADSGKPGAKLKVFVSILPQSDFVKRIGGNHVDVQVLIGRGQSEHSYEPTPKQMLSLADSKAFFAIGVSAERRFVEQAAANHKNLKIVRTQQGIKLRKMSHDEECNDPGHDHGDGHGHEEGDDPHIWLDPQLVKVQAQTICDVLSEVDSAHAGEYAANLKAFQAELDAADQKIANALEPLKGKELFVFHPSYGYFCDRYGLKQVAVEHEGKDPSPKQLEELQRRAKAAGVRVVFYQPQFSKQPAEVIARAIGGDAIALDPLAEDYLKNLENMAASVARALSKPAAAADHR